MPSASRIAALAAGALLLSSSAQAGEWVDVRFSVPFCGSGLLGEEKTVGSSSQFFDNYDRRASKWQLGCFARSFFDDYDTGRSGLELPLDFLVHHGVRTGAFAADFGFALRPSWTAGTLTLRDDSSFLRVRWQPEGWREGEGVSLVAFPISSDRFRLGFSRRISWGGSNLLPTTRPVPAASVQLDRGPLRAYVGLKTARIISQQINEEESNASVLGGASYDLARFRIEANGGYFQRGVNPKQEVLGAPVRTFGGSVQASYAVGEGVTRLPSLTLNTDDPTSPRNVFQREQYPGGLSWLVSAEATALGTTLADPDPRNAGKLTTQPAFAADIQARVKYERLRVQLTAMARDLSFMVLNLPSLPPFQAMPKEMQTTPELMASLTADYHLPRLRLTPGLTLGWQRAATLTSSSAVFPDPSRATRTALIRDDPTFPGRTLLDVMPNSCGPTKKEACTPGALLAAKAFVRADLTDWLVGFVELHGEYNPNRIDYQDDATGVATRTRASPYAYAFNAALSAGF